MKTIKENTLCQKIESRIAEKVKSLNFLPPQAAILDIFWRGAPWFSNFLKFFLRKLDQEV